MRDRIARTLAWILIPLYLTGLTTAWLVGRQNATGAPWGETLLIVGFGACVGMGALLLARRPENPIGWILATGGVLIAFGIALESYAFATAADSGRIDWLATAGLWLNSWYWLPLLGLLLVLVPLLFPDGRPPSHRWRPVVVIVAASIGMMAIGGMFTATLESQPRGYLEARAPGEPFTCEVDEDTPPGYVECHLATDNPIGLDGLPGVEEGYFFLIFGPVLPLGIIAAIVAIVIRFRRSHGVERQQLKVFLYGAAVLPLVIALEGVPILGDLALPLALASLPTAIGLAILRYRLYEIDRLIRRTVTYALVVAAVVGVYLLGVLALGSVVAGESDLAVAASTLVAAAAFGPLLRRVRAAVDRRFDRARYDAELAVQRFAVRLRDEVDLDTVAHDLQGTVTRTLAPSSVQVWLRGAP